MRTYFDFYTRDEDIFIELALIGMTPKRPDL